MALGLQGHSEVGDLGASELGEGLKVNSSLQMLCIVSGFSHFCFFLCALCCFQYLC